MTIRRYAYLNNLFNLNCLAHTSKAKDIWSGMVTIPLPVPQALHKIKSCQQGFIFMLYRLIRLKFDFIFIIVWDKNLHSLSTCYANSNILPVKMIGRSN